MPQLNAFREFTVHSTKKQNSSRAKAVYLSQRIDVRIHEDQRVLSSQGGVTERRELYRERI